MIVYSQEQVAKLQQTVIVNAEKSLDKIKENADTMRALQFFSAIKFEKTGADPITGQALNLIEQINQMFSDLVVLEATQNLLEWFPNKSFEPQLGVTAGHDVQSTDGKVAAECFAVTHVASNSKMKKDCEKLIDSAAEYKYVFFYTHEDSNAKLKNRYDRYPEIHFIRISDFGCFRKSPDS